MDVRVTAIDQLLTIHKSAVILYTEDAEHEVLGLRMGQNGQMERSISIGQVQLRKVVHLKRWTDFFETFPVGPNQSIQF